jgi:hypothetical protein
VLLEWRDLLGMQDWLAGLPDKLGAYEEVTGEQRRRGAIANDLLYDQQLLTNRDLLEARANRQAAALAGLRNATPSRDADWMPILADVDERQLIEDFRSMRTLIDKAMKPAEAGRWLARIERLEGVLFWKLVDESAGRIRGNSTLRALHSKAQQQRGQQHQIVQ